MQGERQNVYKVYNKIARWYAANRYTRLTEKKCLDELIALLPAGGAILDLGCGTGVPILKYLTDQNIKVTGVDASSGILTIAKANFPATEFILQDMRELKLNRRFDAIIAWNSFFHLPAEDQPAMFAVFAQHINPGGILLFTSGTAHGEAWGVNGGENLFHGSLDTAEYEDLLRSHNFDVIKHIVDDKECGATVWMARYIG